MGDRISISFKTGSEESVALFSHWGGQEFLSEALEYVSELKRELATNTNQIKNPLDRLEPATVMVDFIRHIEIPNQQRVWSDLYLGKDHNDGDNSDNGHNTIDLQTGRVL